MARFFNTAGVCEPRKHYMLPPRRRLPGVMTLIDEEAYFVVHAPRQSGKTTCFHHLARELTAAGRYAALLTTCETARTAGDDVGRGVNIVLHAVSEDARKDLPEELRPRPPETFASLPAEMQLNRYLADWCERSSRPVVLFLDEIEAQELAYGLPRGQPWLVKALARQVVTREAPDAATEITPEYVERAKEALILRRDTHLDSLANRLREARIRRVIEPIVAGEYPHEEIPQDDIDFVRDLGLVAPGPGGLGMANPIYREVVPRALTASTELFLPVDERAYVSSDGHLDFGRLLDDFVAFWREHAESFLERQPYSEAAAQLVCMAYLQRIVNGGGTIDREYAVGSGRIDLCVRWPLAGGTLQRFALELKVWREGRSDPLEVGLRQLSGYLERLGLDRGTLIIFDQRSAAAPFAERGTRAPRKVKRQERPVLRL